MDRQQKIEAAAKMRSDGLTYKAIANHFGTGKETVRQWLNSEALKRHRERSRERKLQSANRFAIALQTAKLKAKNCRYAPCGATVEELAAAFDGHCAICGAHESTLSKRLAMDHCHTTGEFRGWLCFACNTGIGKLRDDAAGILNYLNPSHAALLLNALV